MINDNQIIVVRNMTDQNVIYIVPEMGVRRKFSPFESKKITAKELRQLWYLAGGARLLQNYLAVENQELAEEFGVSEDLFTHEYSWTKEDIDENLKNGSLELLEDAFDFAPTGICETLVTRAIQLKIPDRNKHLLIQRVTGRDISKMIEYKEKIDSLSEENLNQEARPRTRRVGGKDKNSSTGRRVG